MPEENNWCQIENEKEVVITRKSKLKFLCSLHLCRSTTHMFWPRIKELPIFLNIYSVDIAVLSLNLHSQLTNN